MGYKPQFFKIPNKVIDPLNSTNNQIVFRALYDLLPELIYSGSTNVHRLSLTGSGWTVAVTDSSTTQTGRPGSVISNIQEGDVQLSFTADSGYTINPANIHLTDEDGVSIPVTGNPFTFSMNKNCTVSYAASPIVRYTVAWSKTGEKEDKGTVRVLAGGSEISSGTRLVAGTSVTFSASFIDGQASFGGWYSGTSLISSDQNFTTTLNSDMNLVAKFDAPVTSLATLWIWGSGMKFKIDGTDATPYTGWRPYDTRNDQTDQAYITQVSQGSHTISCYLITEDNVPQQGLGGLKDGAVGWKVSSIGISDGLRNKDYTGWATVAPTVHQFTITVGPTGYTIKFALNSPPDRFAIAYTPSHVAEITGRVANLNGKINGQDCVLNNTYTPGTKITLEHGTVSSGYSFNGYKIVDASATPTHSDISIPANQGYFYMPAYPVKVVDNCVAVESWIYTLPRITTGVINYRVKVENGTWVYPSLTQDVTFAVAKSVSTFNLTLETYVSSGLNCYRIYEVDLPGSHYGPYTNVVHSGLIFTISNSTNYTFAVSIRQYSRFKVGFYDEAGLTSSWGSSSPLSESNFISTDAQTGSISGVYNFDVTAGSDKTYNVELSSTKSFKFAYDRGSGQGPQTYDTAVEFPAQVQTSLPISFNLATYYAGNASGWYTEGRYLRFTSPATVRQLSVVAGSGVTSVHIGSASGPTSADITVGSNVTVLALFDTTTYVFEGWYSGSTKVSSSASYSFTMPNSDLTLTAQVSEVAIKHYSSTGGVLVDDATSGTARVGDTLTLSIDPDVFPHSYVRYYLVDGVALPEGQDTWVVPSSGDNFVFTAVGYDKQITIVEGLGISAVYIDGDAVSGTWKATLGQHSLSVSVTSGYRFKKAVIDGVEYSTVPSTVTVTASSTSSWTFEAESIAYTSTVNTSHLYDESSPAPLLPPLCGVQVNGSSTWDRYQSVDGYFTFGTSSSYKLRIYCRTALQYALLVKTPSPSGLVVSYNSTGTEVINAVTYNYYEYDVTVVPGQYNISFEIGTGDYKTIPLSVQGNIEWLINGVAVSSSWVANVGETYAINYRLTGTAEEQFKRAVINGNVYLSDEFPIGGVQFVVRGSTSTSSSDWLLESGLTPHNVTVDVSGILDASYGEPPQYLSYSVDGVTWSDPFEADPQTPGVFHFDCEGDTVYVRPYSPDYPSGYDPDNEPHCQFVFMEGTGVSSVSSDYIYTEDGSVPPYYYTTVELELITSEEQVDIFTEPIDS